MRVWIDYQDDPDVPTVECEVDAVPRVGEKVGVRPILGEDGEPIPRQFFLDFVVEVRHYLVPVEVAHAHREKGLPDIRRYAEQNPDARIWPEIRVLTSSSR